MNGYQRGASAWPQALPWHRLPAQMPRLAWLEIAGAVLILFMLVCFYQVVSGAVQHADVHRRTDVAQAEAESRCREMPEQSNRESCLARLGIEPDEPE